MNAEEQQAFKDTLREGFRPGVGLDLPACAKLAKALWETLESSGVTDGQCAYILGAMLGTQIGCSADANSALLISEFAARTINNAICQCADAGDAAGGDLPMSLAADIEAIGDELVAAFHERRLAASLDYLLLRLESAAIRAAALEAGRSAAVTVFVAGEDTPRGRFLTTSPWPRPASQPPAAGNVYAFPARTEPRR